MFSPPHVPLPYLAPAVCSGGSKSLTSFNSILPTASDAGIVIILITEKETEAVVPLLLGFLRITPVALRLCQELFWGWSP